MTTKIRLSLYNAKGALASIENGDGDSVDIAISRTSKSAQAICSRAAETLRKLADKFDVLAATEDPFKVTTQQKVNNKKAAARICDESFDCNAGDHSDCCPARKE